MENEPEVQEKYQPGVGAHIGAVFGGIGVAIILPWPMLLVAGLICLFDVCFMANHPFWTAGISVVLGFILGMVIVYMQLEESHNKKQAELQQQRAEETQRRLNEAQLRWLEEQERNKSEDQ
ncbi:MAG: hypothetical protein F4X65_12925 [Chloroflexi bacterium]|nr:hypothetical protein [Chloroflexota bacterium]